MTAARCSPIERLCATLAFVCDERHTRVMDAAARQGLTPTEFGYIDDDGPYCPVWGVEDLPTCEHNLDAYVSALNRCWTFGDACLVEFAGAVSSTLRETPSLYLVAFRRNLGICSNRHNLVEVGEAMEQVRAMVDSVLRRNRAALL